MLDRSIVLCLYEVHIAPQPLASRYQSIHSLVDFF